MSDEFDNLKHIMTAATPSPDAQRRAETLALAQKNYETLQGSQPAARPTSEPGRTGLWTGVKTMLNRLTSPVAATSATALLACGVIFLTPVSQDFWNASGRFAAAPKAPSEEPLIVDGLHMGVAPEANATRPEELRTEADFAERLLAQEAQTVQRTADAVAGEVVLEQRMDVAPEVIEAPVVVVDTPAPQFSALAELSTFADRVAQETNLAQSVREITPSWEAFPETAPNNLQITQENPVSTFSIDVDTASYSFVRSRLTAGEWPPFYSVRVEELINYFPYEYPRPDGDVPFRPTVTTFETPWNADTQLVHIALQGQMPEVEARLPLNLVFLIDTSGSMDQPNKLPLLKQSFRLMLNELRPEDEVAIVEYAGSAGEVLAPTPASDRSTILQAIQGLGAGGSTNGQGGLEQAYAVAGQMAEEDEVSRVILATDGDFNVGLSNPDALKDFIADKRETGTYLSVLGFGRGNLDDATIQALAQNGNGTAAYIDTLSEAQKVLVDQLTGALFTIASDVKVQVEFNPAQIAEYRLIGYEARTLRREDFNNDRVDAGELGAGHTVTAIYEVTPVGSPAQLSDPLRYDESTVSDTSQELGFLKLRYKAPGEDVSQLIETPIIGQDTPGPEVLFGTAIAGFGQLLRGNTALGDWGYDEAIALANANRGEDPFGYRTEAVQLMRLAQSLSDSRSEN